MPFLTFGSHRCSLDRYLCKRQIWLIVSAPTRVEALDHHTLSVEFGCFRLLFTNLDCTDKAIKRFQTLLAVQMT